MKIFAVDKFLNRVNVSLFGLKFKFRLPLNKTNYYVSLGKNCFVRCKLTTCGLKSKRKQGELSYPFDLCVTPALSVAAILENDFVDYFKDLKFDREHDYYINTKYDIKYVHDGELTRDEFVDRYKKRIINFREISKNSNKIFYMMSCYGNDFSIDSLNSIYKSLVKYRENKPFKFMIAVFVDKNDKDFNTKNLNSNIILKTYETPYGPEKFYDTWFHGHEFDNDTINSVLLDVDKLKVS